VVVDRQEMIAGDEPASVLDMPPVPEHKEQRAGRQRKRTRTTTTLVYTAAMASMNEDGGDYAAVSRRFCCRERIFFGSEEFRVGSGRLVVLKKCREG
jgi:hypothetical protein